MASANWHKMTKKKASAMKIHFNKAERLEAIHANPDIDKSKSYLNTYIGCSDYDDAIQKMFRRVGEVDKEYPPEKITKDRIICSHIEVSCPQAICDLGKSEDFFENVHKIMQSFFGIENVHGTFTHYDEIHDYIDKNNVVRTSLPHSTTLVSAYVDWLDAIYKRDDKGHILQAPKLDKNGNPKLNAKGQPIMERLREYDEEGKPLFRERHGINGKNFEQKQRYNILNNKIEAFCQNNYHVNFLTGEQAQHKTVEILKAESELAAKRAEVQKESKLCQQLQQKNAQQKQLFIQMTAPPPRPIKPKRPPDVECFVQRYEFYSKEDVKEYKENYKRWQEIDRQRKKEQQVYDAETLPNWEKENAKWEAEYGFAENVQKASALVQGKSDELTTAIRQNKARQEQLNSRQQSLDNKELALKKRAEALDSEVQTRADNILNHLERYKEYMATASQWQERYNKIIETGDKNESRNAMQTKNTKSAQNYRG